MSASPAGATDDGGATGSPSVQLEGAATDWTAIRSGIPDSAAGSGFSGARFAGQCVGEGGAGCRADDVQRVAYDFGDLGDPAALEDGVVVSATLSVPVVQDQDCGIRNVSVHRVPAVTSETTWANSADRWRSALDDASSVECGGDRRIEFDVTSGVQRAARSGQALAFGLAGDEGCRGCGRASFGPDARLTVELRSPDVVEPTGVQVYGSSWPCAVGEDRPAVRSTTPKLTARLSNDREPSPTSMSAVFAVQDLESGAELWRSEPTFPLGSGSTHTRTVPSDVLEHGGTYAWTAQAVLPSGNLTDPVGCELTVDTQAPGAVTITPADGYPAVYAEDVETGGIGETGGFVLAADDETSVHYSFDSDALSDRAVPGEVVEYTPTEPGVHRLYAEAVDAAGNVGPQVMYRFDVAYPVPVGGAWHFGESAGLQTASSLEDGRVLTLANEQMWTPGLFADFGIDPSDGALLLDGAEDVAAADGPVIDPAGNLTVAAFMKPAADGMTADVIAQGGDAGTGFALGTVTDESCTSATGTCWSFAVGEGDGTSRATAVSDVAVTPGEWMFVAGIHNATTGAVDLWTCALSGWDGLQMSGSTTAAPLVADVGGRFAVGGSEWQGSVDTVRVLDTIQTETKLQRWCSGSPVP
ncbi:LamG domain-containing protein [Isoptericola sp. BMS4]|uniref:LamG domain-containing protein n=1 Tax=Isoptericola sp. BMS4 TaxID=2527875 RepID=UPI0014244088|nr:LamG domain-containing protein [Isoptericola sp. BMS4]